VASNTGVPILRPAAQAAAEAGPAAEPVAAGDTASWLVDPETLLLVEDDAGDALLVVPRDRAQDVRAVVEALKKKGRGDKL